MINDYCESLDGVFAQMVYYGLLKEEDAQCFSVRSNIEGGSYLLVLGSILLALLSSFVSKAFIQYLRDQGQAEKRLRDEEDGSDCTTHSEDGSTVGDTSARIHPVPVLFTDTFRWLLFQENNHWGLPDAQYHWDSPTSNRALFLPEARVLSEEPNDEKNAPAVYGKLPQKAKQDDTSPASKAKFIGFRSKQSPSGKEASKKPPPQTSLLRGGSISSQESDRKMPARDSFKDESSVFSRDSLSKSATESVAGRSNAKSTYESVEESVFPLEEDVYEELILTDGATEYEEQTVDESYFEEITVLSDDEEETVESLHHLI